MAYYGSLRVFISSSQCAECSLCVFDATGTRLQYKFQVPMGISCFALCEGFLIALQLNASRSIHSFWSIIVFFFFFIRESHASNWWTGLCGPRLEPLRSREGERRTSWTPFNHLRTRCDRRRQAYLFFVEGQMHKGVGRPDPKLHSGCWEVTQLSNIIFFFFYTLFRGCAKCSDNFIYIYKINNRKYTFFSNRRTISYPESWANMLRWP